MTAKEALRWMENDTGIMSCNDPAWPIAIRALRLLAAAEANGGQVAEVAQGLRSVADLMYLPDSENDKMLAGAAMIESLAARVRELEKDAERYRWLRKPQDHICVDVEEENEDGWTGTFYALVRDELDAAIDAARGSEP